MVNSPDQDAFQHGVFMNETQCPKIDTNRRGLLLANSRETHQIRDSEIQHQKGFWALDWLVPCYRQICVSPAN